MCNAHAIVTASLDVRSSEAINKADMALPVECRSPGTCERSAFRSNNASMLPG
jgi:hypothetical protein